MDPWTHPASERDIQGQIDRILSFNPEDPRNYDPDFVVRALSLGMTPRELSDAGRASSIQRDPPFSLHNWLWQQAIPAGGLEFADATIGRTYRAADRPLSVADFIGVGSLLDLGDAINAASQGRGSPGTLEAATFGLLDAVPYAVAAAPLARSAMRGAPDAIADFIRSDAGAVRMGGMRVYHGGPDLVVAPEARPDPEGLLPGFSVARTPDVADFYARLRGGGVVSEFDINERALNAISEDDLYRLIDDMETSLGFDEGGMPDYILQDRLREMGINAISYPDEDFGIRILDTSILSPASASPTPAQEIMRLLREGRADEVTNDLYSAADPLELTERYVRGESGIDMPMDEASRMARAREMGFDTDTPMYHATAADFPAFDDAFLGQQTSENAINFDEGSWANNLAMSGHWSNDQPLAEFVSSPIDMPVYTAGDLSSFGSLDHLSGYIDEVGGVDAFRGRHRGSSVSDEEMGGMSRVIVDPRNIRSRFARFDPRLSHLSHLSAAVAPVGVGYGLLSPQEAQAAEIEQYLGLLGMQ